MDQKSDIKQDAKSEPKPQPAKMEAPVAAKRVAPLRADRWQLGEYVNARHAVTLEAGVPFESILQPEFWANIVRLKPDDIIEVRTDDRKFYAELLVMARGRNWATVAVIREPVALKSAAQPQSQASAFRVEYTGSHGQFAVVKQSDNSLVRDKFATQEAADGWVKQQEKLIGVPA